MEPLAANDPVEIAGYQLRARLGSGGMGRVYLAFTPAGRPVALKVVRPDLGNDAEFRRRFRQEVDASRRVHGMYTAQVLDAGPDASPPWLATAYVPGPSLHQAVAEHGPMPEQTVFVLLAGVAEALAAIHAVGIVHRDLKPSNVLLAPDGPRVIDFGIARAADSTVMTGTGMLIGSPPFMAPEQVKGDHVTPAVDVFALGAVAVFAATGRSPFGEGMDMGILYRVAHEEPDLTGCPPRLREVVRRCLVKDPAARPSPAEIIAVCREQAAGQAAGTAPWLPPEMLAAIAQHAPPPAPLSPQALASQGLQMPPATQTSGGWQAPWAPMTHASTAPVVPSATISANPYGANPYGVNPYAANPHGAVPPGVVPPGGGRGGYETHPVRRGVTRPVVLGSVFAGIGVTALAVVGVLALGGHGGHTPAPATPTTAAQSLSAAGTTAPVTPSTSAKTSYAVDSCVVGNWKDTADELDNTQYNGQIARFTGQGGGMQIGADGHVKEELGPETLTATSDGNLWTEVLTGSITMHATTSQGKLTFSNIAASPDAGYKLYENGIYNNSGPMSASTTPNRYTCSSSILRMSWSDGSSVYQRVS